MKRFKVILLAISIFLSGTSYAAAENAWRGNTRITSYEDAKRILYSTIYRRDEERRTIYCGFRFDGARNIDLPHGFPLGKYAARATRAESEHVVPAENFGRAFPEWREGAPVCVDGRGHPYKGRRCAEASSPKFRLMEADLHNLWPSVGSVNAARANYNFTDLGIAVNATTFGPTCPMSIEGRRAQPPERSRGVIARAYLYQTRRKTSSFRERI